MSYDIIQEDSDLVPPFTKRVGDYALAGSNNTYIILGTDRAKKGPAKLADGLGHVKAAGKGKGTGTIHLIAGMKDKEGNPDLDKDLSYIYLTMKTEVDKHLGTDMEGDGGKSPAAIIKSDMIRTVFRKNIKIALDGSKTYAFIDKDKVIIHLDDTKSIIEMTASKIKIQNDGKGYITIEGDKITVDGKNIHLGDGAKEQLVLGNAFKTFFEAHIHPSPVGPTGKPIEPFLEPSLLSQQKVFVK